MSAVVDGNAEIFGGCALSTVYGWLHDGLFGAILTDNGTEFSDPSMIENYRPNPLHNPTRLLPRGVRVWYAGPYCSSQKPHVERFHLDLRRVLTKGTSFNPLDQEQMALVFSHLDSSPRQQRPQNRTWRRGAGALYQNLPLRGEKDG